MWNREKLDLTTSWVSPICDLIQVPEYVNYKKIERQVQRNLEHYFVFFYRVFKAWRKLDETDPLPSCFRVCYK